MPVSTADAVAKRMQKVGMATQKAMKISMVEAAKAAKAVQVAGLNVDAPGGRLRNVGKKGAKLGVGYKIQGGANNPTAIVEAVGSGWPILNNPTKAHQIQGRKGKTLKLPNGFRRGVQHPGTRGKRTWQKGEPEAEKVASKELSKTMTRAVQEAFKG